MPQDQHEILPKMRDEVAAVLDDCPAVWESGRLVVGVSGGPDSLSLLHLLRFTLQPIFKSEERPLQLIVGHLNHMFRTEADDEAAFVQQLCREWNLDLYMERVDVPGLAAEQDGSLEETARQVRYKFLAQVAMETGTSTVAVAHNADDQAETVLMHFLRGAGPAGLRGMRPVSPLPGAPHLNLLRPLLFVSRAEIEAYCAQQDLEPIIDRSNLDTTFFRNRLRHELMPILETYNPQIRRRLQNSAEVWAADVALLDNLRDTVWEQILLTSGSGWLRFDLAGWQALPLSLRRSTLRHAVWTLQESLRDVGYLPIEQARLCLDKGQVGTQSTLPGDMTLTVEYKTWTLVCPGRAAPPLVDAPQVLNTVPLPVPGEVTLNSPWVIRAQWVERIDLDDVIAQPHKWQVYLHPSCRGDIYIRRRKSGERFQPLGMDGQSTKMKDFMINQKIPAGLRAHWPIVATSDYPIWIPGYRLDHRARLTEDGPAVFLECVQR